MNAYAWPYPQVIAHRGGGVFAPENTLAAMKKALEYGYRAVEFDVMLTRDEVPVLMHDPELGRTVRGRGSIADIDAADLIGMDAGSYFGSQFVGEPVPLYREVVNFCRLHGIWMNVELKPVPGHAARTGEVIAALTRELFADEHDPARRPMFNSFDAEALAAARAVAPEFARCLTVERIPADWRGRLRELECFAFDCNHLYLTSEAVAAIRAEGYRVTSYLIEDVHRAQEMMTWRVDAICTDRIDLIPATF